MYNLTNIKQDPSSHPKYHVSVQNPPRKNLQSKNLSPKILNEWI